MTNSLIATEDTDGNGDGDEVGYEDENGEEVSEMVRSEDWYGEGVFGVVSVVVSREVYEETGNEKAGIGDGYRKQVSEVVSEVVSGIGDHV